MGDHTEALQIDFDPEKITFEKVSELFWKSHNACRTPYSRQYMSAFWYASPQQESALREHMESVMAESDGEIKTVVAPLESFYLAEDYHQKYCLQSSAVLMERFRIFYPDFTDFVNSTAAARLNGMIYGNRAMQLFVEEGHSYGFEFEELKKLLR